MSAVKGPSAACPILAEKLNKPPFGADPILVA